MRLGAHLSMARGFAAMAKVAAALGCETVQVFSRSPRGGKPRELRAEDVREMRARLAAASITPLAIHVPYFVNLASPEPPTWEYSLETVALDLERGRELGAEYVITHPGSHGPDEPAAAGLDRVAEGLRRVLAGRAAPPTLLLEQTAGGGRQLGGDLRELRAILEQIGPAGVCLDTCHAFAAGYDLRSPGGREALLADVEAQVGLDRVNLIHLNDSLDPPGAHRDTHVRVGDGLLGEAAFRGLLRDPRLERLPGILETPRRSEDDLAEELERLRRWRSE